MVRDIWNVMQIDQHSCMFLAFTNQYLDLLHVWTPSVWYCPVHDAKPGKGHSARLHLGIGSLPHKAVIWLWNIFGNFCVRQSGMHLKPTCRPFEGLITFGNVLEVLRLCFRLSQLIGLMDFIGGQAWFRRHIRNISESCPELSELCPKNQ